MRWPWSKNKPLEDLLKKIHLKEKEVLKCNDVCRYVCKKYTVRSPLYRAALAKKHRTKAELEELYALKYVELA